jgi:hypothetical protein
VDFNREGMEKARSAVSLATVGSDLHLPLRNEDENHKTQCTISVIAKSMPCI